MINYNSSTINSIEDLPHKGSGLTDFSQEPISIGNYQGNIAPEFDTPALRLQLADISDLIKNPAVVKLSNGPDYVVKLTLQTATGQVNVALKIFKRQNWFKDRFDSKHKSKAERSFIAARHLQAHNIGTPAPIAWLDRWEKNRLIESYFLTVFEPALCFRDALIDIYENARDCEPLMALMHSVAPAIKAMHDANFMHGDMGNQNILVPKNADGSWAQPQFIDLNRALIPGRPLTLKERAFDLSRPILPGNFFKFFKFIYWDHQMLPRELDKNESKYRARFEWHRKSRKFRHPIRHLKNRNKPSTHPQYPANTDFWLWDEKTAQPTIALSRKEKHRERFLSDIIVAIARGILAIPQIRREYQNLKQLSFQQPLSMKGRVGVALHPHEGYINNELELLAQLGNPPVLLRFCHHENDLIWDRTIALVTQLHEQGIEIMIALLQDREAVLQPEKWSAFLTKIIPSIVDKVAHIEITHAFNRIKWGVWNMGELLSLMKPAFDLQKKFPHIKLTGPACIDFEYLPVIHALKSLPRDYKFSALSHLLYVDRRGAPENPQGQFSTLEKCALLKSLARISPQCDDKVIISEVNWPLANTDIWSPIVTPYVTPHWEVRPSGETDNDYANFMLRYIAIAICSGHIDQLFWWRLSAKGYGLVDDQHNFQPRLAFFALKFFLHLLGETTFVKKWPSSPDIYILEFHSATQEILMLWTKQGESQDFPNFTADLIFNRDGEPISTKLINESPSYWVKERTLI